MNEWNKWMNEWIHTYIHTTINKWMNEWMHKYIHTYIHTHTYIQSYKYVFAGFGLASIVPKKCFTANLWFFSSFWACFGTCAAGRWYCSVAVCLVLQYCQRDAVPQRSRVSTQSSVAWSARWGGETSTDSWKLARSSAQPRFLSLWWRNILIWESVSCASCSADTIKTIR